MPFFSPYILQCYGATYYCEANSATVKVESWFKDYNSSHHLAKLNFFLWYLVAFVIVRSRKWEIIAFESNSQKSSMSREYDNQLCKCYGLCYDWSDYKSVNVRYKGHNHFQLFFHFQTNSWRNNSMPDWIGTVYWHGV